MSSPIERAARSPVQSPWDGRFRRRDERSDRVTGGVSSWTSGGDGRLSVAAIYAVTAGLVAASTVVGTFSGARDISWRLGSPHNFWEPALWNGTSGIVVLALLPTVRRGETLLPAH